MPSAPVPADPGWDEDLTWLDRDPERQTWLARAREHDEPPPEEEQDHDYEPLTAEELAEISEAAADELLAVEAAATGRRGLGQPGSARVFPGESSSPAAAFAPGMPLDTLPGCAQLAAAADAAGEGRFAGISEAELVGLLCAWDRAEAHAAARKLAVIAELARRNPAPEDAEFTSDEIASSVRSVRTPVPVGLGGLFGWVTGMGFGAGPGERAAAVARLGEQRPFAVEHGRQALARGVVAFHRLGDALGDAGKAACR
jgi:hypothetical protein